MITKLTPVAATIFRRRLVLVTKQRMRKLNRELTALIFGGSRDRSYRHAR